MVPEEAAEQAEEEVRLLVLHALGVLVHMAVEAAEAEDPNTEAGREAPVELTAVEEEEEEPEQWQVEPLQQAADQEPEVVTDLEGRVEITLIK